MHHFATLTQRFEVMWFRSADLPANSSRFPAQRRACTSNARHAYVLGARRGVGVRQLHIAPRTMAGGARSSSVARSVGSGDRRKGKRLSKKESVKQVVALGAGLLRGSAARQVVPLAVLAASNTALIHVTARTQGELFRTVFLGDTPAFVRLLARNLVLCIGAAVFESTKTLAEGALALRWRTALTERSHRAFFTGTVYYRLGQLDRRIENAGELIAGDVPLFTDELATMLVETCTATTNAAFFLHQMRKTGGTQSVLAILGYVVVGGTVVFGLSPNLARMHGRTRELESRYRALHARLRQWCEAVAFAAGEAVEASHLKRAFRAVTKHTSGVLFRTWWYRVIFDFFVKYVATTFSVYLIMGPFIMGPRGHKSNDSLARKAATLGRMRYHTDVIIHAFGGVGALAGVLNQLGQLGGYAQRITQLLTVTAELADTEATELATAAKACAIDDGRGIGFEALTVVTPTGAVLVKDLTLRVQPGINLLVTGPNGAGKSSLFRVLGGLWQPKTGRVIKPASQGGDGSAGANMGLASDIFYVPQRPYVSVGTLREQITYPQASSALELPDETLRQLLARVELDHLIDEAASGAGLDAVVDWSEVLSLGEQQRLGLARLFHAKPRVAILDECTSAVTMAMEQKLCAELRSAGCSCVTISHRPALVAVHQLNLALDGQGGFRIRELNEHTAVETEEGLGATPKTSVLHDEQAVHGRVLAHAPPVSTSSPASSVAAAAAAAAAASAAPRVVHGTRMQRIGQLLKILVPSFWGADGRGLLLLTAVIVCRTWLSDRIAHLNGETMRHIIGQDRRQFVTLLGGSLVQAAAQAVLAPSMLSLAEAVALTWRDRLTAHLSELYFRSRGYYTMPNLHSLSDADQRIAEDVPKLSTTLAALFPGLVKPIVDIAWFSVRMWQLTGKTGVALLYAYMFFGLGCLRLIAPDFGGMEARSSRLEGEFRHTHARLKAHAESVAFCGGGPYEQRSADGRFAQLAKHSKSVLRRKWTFGIADHFLTKELPHNVTWGLSMLFVVKFGDTLGDLQRQGDLAHDLRFLATTVSHSFNAFGEILDLYKKFDELGGHALRVHTLLDTLESASAVAKDMDEEASHSPGSPGRFTARNSKYHPGTPRTAARGRVRTAAGPPVGVQAAPPQEEEELEALLTLTDVTVSTPSGSGAGAGGVVVARNLDLCVSAGESLLLTGPNGSGKSALARVICGLWPAAQGSGAASVLDGLRKDDLVYVPQRPYLTVGNLREQLTYPYRSSDPHVKKLAQERHGVTDEAWDNGAGLDVKLAELLELVGLLPLLSRTYDDNGSAGGDGSLPSNSGWEATTTWESVLSLGEQQRLGMARLFFRKPRLAILDEATNATSVDIEDRLYSIATGNAGGGGSSSTAGADVGVGAGMGMTCITISQRRDVL